MHAIVPPYLLSRLADTSALAELDREAPGDVLVFLPGTHGTPPGPRRFLKAAADAGYRVISLDYNDEPATNVYCPRRPDPNCTEKFRQMRIYGDGTLNPRIDNTPDWARDPNTSPQTPPIS